MLVWANQAFAWKKVLDWQVVAQTKVYGKPWIRCSTTKQQPESI